MGYVEIALVALQFLFYIVKECIGAAAEAKRLKKEWIISREAFDKIIQAAMAKMKFDAVKDKKDSDSVDDQLDGR